MTSNTELPEQEASTVATHFTQVPNAEKSKIIAEEMRF